MYNERNETGEEAYDLRTDRPSQDQNADHSELDQTRLDRLWRGTERIGFVDCKIMPMQLNAESNLRRTWHLCRNKRLTQIE